MPECQLKAELNSTSLYQPCLIQIRNLRGEKREAKSRSRFLLDPIGDGQVLD